MSDRTTPPNETKAGVIHNDPWGDRGNQGPPDLDEAIKKLQGQLSGLFGGGSSGGGGSGGGFLKGLSTFGFLAFLPQLRLPTWSWVSTRWMSRNEY